MSWTDQHRCWLSLLLAVLTMAGCASRPQERVGPDSAEVQAHWQEAHILLESGDREQARARFAQIQRQAPGLVGPRLNLCVMAFEDARPQLPNLIDNDQARAEAGQLEGCFNDVLALRSGEPVALTHLGILARYAGRFDDAEHYYREALFTRPDHGPALLNLGILLDLYRGKPAEALDLFEQYQSLQPEPDPTVQNWVADLKNRL